MSYHHKPRTNSSNLSSISNKYKLVQDSTTNNLLIRIELKHLEYLSIYIDVLENYVKSYSKKYRITEFHIVYDWSSCDIWVFKTNIPFGLIVE